MIVDPLYTSCVLGCSFFDINKSYYLSKTACIHKSRKHGKKLTVKCSVKNIYIYIYIIVILEMFKTWLGHCHDKVPRWWKKLKRKKKKKWDFLQPPTIWAVDKVFRVVNNYTSLTLEHQRSRKSNIHIKSPKTHKSG